MCNPPSSNLVGTANSAFATEVPLYSVRSVAPEQLGLVERFYRAHGYKLKCGHGERVFAMSRTKGEASLGTEWVAVVRLVPQVSGHYWLRNLLVAPTQRGVGLASRLLDCLKPAVSPHGCYCFALPHLTRLYARAGFEPAPEHCPYDIMEIYRRYKSRGRDWILMGYLQESPIY